MSWRAHQHRSPREWPRLKHRDRATLVGQAEGGWEPGTPTKRASRDCMGFHRTAVYTELQENPDTNSTRI